MTGLRAFCVFVFVSALLFACAGRKLRTDLPKYVSVTAELKDPDNTVKAALFVFAIDSKCKWEQVAQYRLEPGTVELGLPASEKFVLEFVFSATSMFSANRQISHQSPLTAKDGAKYQILANYNKGMYFVETKEFLAGQRAGKVIERQDPHDCQPVK